MPRIPRAAVLFPILPPPINAAGAARGLHEDGRKPPAPIRTGLLPIPQHEWLDQGHGYPRRIPGARLVVVRGAGHLSNLEQPQAFDAAVLPFLLEHRDRASAARPPKQ